MKIVGFPVDVSSLRDERIVRGQSIRRSLIQATLDLIQAGDVEPTSGAVATIAGLPSRTLFQHFTSLSDLYAAAFDFAASRAFSPDRQVDSAAPLASRIALLVSDRAQLFEAWLPLWSFAERVRRVAPAVGPLASTIALMARIAAAVCLRLSLRWAITSPWAIAIVAPPNMAPAESAPITAKTKVFLIGPSPLNSTGRRTIYALPVLYLLQRLGRKRTVT